MVNTKCIRYSVDPRLLNEGIPFEQLEKRNMQVFQSQETIEHLVRYSVSTQALFKDKSLEHFPKPIERLEIELSLEDYKKVLGGRLIKISHDIAKHQGKKFRVVNKTTGSYVMRILIVMGERGCWQ